MNDIGAEGQMQTKHTKASATADELRKTQISEKQKNKKALVEAALFMSSNPIQLKQLVKITNLPEQEIVELLKEIKNNYNNEEHGIHLIETNEGYQFKVKVDYISNVRNLTPYQDLSRGLLRVLALVAYKQPITQSQIVKVIGNRTYEYVKKLEDKGLIRTVKAGRTKALIATKGFADYFGLESVEDAKKLFESLPEETEEKETNSQEA